VCEGRLPWLSPARRLPTPPQCPQKIQERGGQVGVVFQQASMKGAGGAAERPRASRLRACRPRARPKFFKRVAARVQFRGCPNVLVEHVPRL